MSEWFYLWHQLPGGTWSFAGHYYGNRSQAQMLSGGMQPFMWRITDSNNYEVLPPEVPTFSANTQLATAQSLGVEAYGWTK